jgi:hypothetical protein
MPDDRPPPSRAAIARAFRGWRPPMPFTVAVHFAQDTGRAPEALWVAPWLVDAETGRPVLYLAAGPSGKVLENERVVGFSWPDIPDGLRIQVLMGGDYAGRAAFRQPAHTLN